MPPAITFAVAVKTRILTANHVGELGYRLPFIRGGCGDEKTFNCS